MTAGTALASARARRCLPTVVCLGPAMRKGSPHLTWMWGMDGCAIGMHMQAGTWIKGQAADQRAGPSPAARKSRCIEEALRSDG